MAIYQVFDTFSAGFTTDYQQAKEFLRKIEPSEFRGSKGIYLLKLDEETGKFEEGDFVDLKNVERTPLRKITASEKRKLPDELYILDNNTEVSVGFDTYISYESRIRDLFEYTDYEDFTNIFREFGDLVDNFGAHMIFTEVIYGHWYGRLDRSLEDTIERIKSLDVELIETVKVGQITDLNYMNSMADEYISRVSKEKLRKAYDFGKQHVKIVQS